MEGISQPNVSRIRVDLYVSKNCVVVCEEGDFTQDVTILSNLMNEEVQAEVAEEVEEETDTARTSHHSCSPRRLLLSIFLGQLLSLFICGTAVSSEYLQRSNVSTPIAQSLLSYLLLAFVFGSIGVYKLTSKGELWSTFRHHGFLYVLAAIIDVEANYAIVKAYQFTSVTSVQLLDCLTIPTVLILSLLLFGIRYRLNHYFGVFLCLVGVIGILVADHMTKGSSFSGSNVVLGDFLVIIGAFFYGVSNVFQEYLVRQNGKLNYMCFLGLFASFISGIQFLALESSETRYLIAKTIENPLIPLWYAMFGLSMFALYSTMPIVMERSSAVIVNLNLLTADVYALIVGLFLFGYHFNWLYFVAYATIMLGVFLYVMREPLMERPNRERILSRIIEKICCCSYQSEEEVQR